MKYLKSSILIKILFRPKRNFIIYFDIDYTIDKIDRKSIIAFIRLLGERPVFWTSKKQVSVSMAIIKAEYIAISFTVK